MDCQRPKPSICFVALNSYNVLAGKPDLKHVGGAEVQQVIIGRWLLSKGYTVRFVTLDHGQVEGGEINGFRVYKAYDKSDGLSGLRFMVPRWSGLWSALTRSQSDVYYQRSSGAETGQVALWCRLHRRPFIFGTANEADCAGDLPFLRSVRERSLYRLGLHLADRVVAQTNTQADLLLKNFGISSAVVRNCAPEAAVRAVGNAAGCAQQVVLWVGRIVPAKRFEWLLEVAKRCGDVWFRVIGAVNHDSHYAADLIRQAGECRNVHFEGEIPHAQMDAVYASARLLLCTSKQEGFPNTFLEAWRIGLPVVTTFDPDGLVRANRMGAVGSTIHELAQSLKTLLGDTPAYHQASARVRAYFSAHHTADAALPAFERVLEEVSAKNRPRVQS